MWRNWILRAALAVVCVSGLALAQDAASPRPSTQPTTRPTTQPGIISVSDNPAIGAAMGKDVIIEGVVHEAAWSRTGRVMNIEFEEAEESRLLAVIFVRKRDEMDQAFGGDVGRALTGARVRLKGKLEPYGGRMPAMQGRPQIILNSPNQITILEPASTQPSAADSPDGGGT